MQLHPIDEATPPMGVVSNHNKAACPIGLAADDLASAATSTSGRSPDLAESCYRRELAWLRSLRPLSKAASCLLAAHAAGGITSWRARKFGAPSGLCEVFASLAASARPDRATLERASSALLADSEADCTLSAHDMAHIDMLWPLTAPTEALLASGGDERLTVDRDTGQNKYGCTPWPRPDVISFGSCTASSLSQDAFEAAESARRALATASLITSPATALAEASEAISLAILDYFGVQDLAEAVLAASGTDAALVVTGLLAAEHPGEALTSILVSPAETGSGVLDAVQGRHFATCSPSGSLVGKGQPIDGLASRPSLETVRLRAADGSTRAQVDINADFEAVIRRRIAGGRVILHAMDGSKTGLSAPDRSTCRRLADNFGPRLDIVIDACQARIEPPLVRWYLEQGFPVLVTGSKFFSAPGFCGAVLFPRLRLQAITKAGRLPAGLAAYARLQGGFGSRRCPGLVLRWTAALHEMSRFRQIPSDLVAERLDRIGQAISAALETDRRLHLMEAPRPSGPGWSGRRSVFTFIVEGSAGRANPDQLRLLYRWLNEDCSSAIKGGEVLCHIGQPVELGSKSLGGLRLAVSSAQIVSDADQAEGLALLMSKLRRLIDRNGVGGTRAPLLSGTRGMRATLAGGLGDMSID